MKFLSSLVRRNLSPPWGWCGLSRQRVSSKFPRAREADYAATKRLERSEEMKKVVDGSRGGKKRVRLNFGAARPKLNAGSGKRGESIASTPINFGESRPCVGDHV